MAVTHSFFGALVDALDFLLGLYIWILIIGAVLSWLVVFDVVNQRNRIVQVVGDLYFRMTEPLLKPIRRYVPPVNGLDLSPLILIVVIWFLRSFLLRLSYSL